MTPRDEAQARCQVHPDVTAAFTCARCGSFSCEACRSEASPGRCQACAAREQAVLGHDVSAAGLLKDSFGLLGPALPGVAVVVVVAFLAERLLSYAVLTPLFLLSSERSVEPYLLSLVFQACTLLVDSATSAGFIRWLADGLLQREQRTMARTLKAALAGSLLLTLQWLLYVCAVGFGLILLVIPGIFLATILALAPAALVIDGHGPVAALKRSLAVTDGHGLRLFLALAPLVVLCKGALILGRGLPFMLKTEGVAGSLAGPVIGFVVTTTLACLIEITIVLAYLRLTRRPAPEPRPVPVAGVVS
jgi:hypothetical protein